MQVRPTRLGRRKRRPATPFRKPAKNRRCEPAWGRRRRAALR
jgi:hypothetical protein